MQSEAAITAPRATGSTRPFALMGYFLTPAEIYKACEELRDAGYTHFDAQTPFPVHGLERAMGLKPSKLPWVVLASGTLGLLSAIALTYFVSTDYPLNISGKPSFSYQAYVPIMFELTVLFSALGTFFGLWTMNRLPMFFHPSLAHPAFERATDDAFFITVEVTDPKYDPKKTRELLERLGARDLVEVAS